jgi:hypothetical protein
MKPGDIDVGHGVLLHDNNPYHLCLEVKKWKISDVVLSYELFPLCVYKCYV